MTNYPMARICYPIIRYPFVPSVIRWEWFPLSVVNRPYYSL